MTVRTTNGSQSISLEVDKLLDDYCEEVEAEVDKIARGVASATANKLKKHSPRGKGMRHYADGWRNKRIEKRHYVVHNTTKPSLTHLLNNGHEKAGGTGTVEGDGHINKADEWAAEEFVRRVEKVL